MKDQKVGRWWWSLRQGRKVSQIAKTESHWQTSEAKMNQQFWDGQTDFPTQKPKTETISIILPHRSAIGRVCEENMQKEVNMSSTVHCNALSVEQKTHLWFDLGRPGPLHLLIHTTLNLFDSVRWLLPKHQGGIHADIHKGISAEKKVRKILKHVRSLNTLQIYC